MFADIKPGLSRAKVMDKMQPWRVSCQTGIEDQRMEKVKHCLHRA